MPHCTPKTRGGKYPKKTTYKRMKKGTTYKKRRGGGNILDQLQKDRLVGGRKKPRRNSMKRR